ncbi:hypothetical protein Tco_1312069 [Tanacetum coccineum]
MLKQSPPVLASVDQYLANKMRGSPLRVFVDLLQTAVTIKRPRDGADDDPKNLRLEQTGGSKRRRSGKKNPLSTVLQDEGLPTFFPDWFQQPTRLPSPDHAWNKSVPAVHESVQPWLSNLARRQDPRDPVYSARLATRRYKSQHPTDRAEIREVYKATTEKLDWINPEGRQYPHDLRQPLPLVPNSQECSQEALSSRWRAGRSSIGCSNAIRRNSTSQKPDRNKGQEEQIEHIANYNKFSNDLLEPTLTKQCKSYDPGDEKKAKTMEDNEREDSLFSRDDVTGRRAFRNEFVRGSIKAVWLTGLDPMILRAAARTRRDLPRDIHYLKKHQSGNSLTIEKMEILLEVNINKLMVEVSKKLKLKNFKKDATLKLFKIGMSMSVHKLQVHKMAKLQDGRGLCLVDDLKDAQDHNVK